MKYIVLFLIALLYIKEIPQPPSITSQGITFTPIVENIELGRSYWYIRTIKIYYKDTLTSPLFFRIGSPLYSYCTDSTRVSFISYSDTLTIHSVKRMSCVILAVINLSDEQTHWMRENNVLEASICNIATQNTYNVTLPDSTYFKRLFTYYQ